jgi:hypothetical protein
VLTLQRGKHICSWLPILLLPPPPQLLLLLLGV